jgi:hypothetical protein
MSKKKKNKFEESIKNAFLFLENSGYIKYDTLIPENVLYTALNLDVDPANPWNFIAPLIKLKQYMEIKGYKTSQRNGIKGLYIEPAYKICRKIEQRRNKVLDQMNRDGLCAYNVNRDSLSNHNQRELDHNLHVISLLNQAMNSILRDIL